MTLKIAICDDCEKDRKHMIQLLLSYAFAHEYDFHIEVNNLCSNEPPVRQA